jgi:hypothetical protein
VSKSVYFKLRIYAEVVVKILGGENRVLSCNLVSVPLAVSPIVAVDRLETLELCTGAGPNPMTPLKTPPNLPLEAPDTLIGRKWEPTVPVNLPPKSW